jgi:hypothetical protein
MVDSERGPGEAVQGTDRNNAAQISSRPCQRSSDQTRSKPTDRMSSVRRAIGGVKPITRTRPPGFMAFRIPRCGQSGGPVYRVIDQNLDRGEIVDRLELLGIIYNRVFDIVLARPAGLVDANGIIAPFVR